jgi:peptide deformylase
MNAMAEPAHDHDHDHDHEHDDDPRLSRKERERRERAEIRRELALRQIRQYPDPILRTPATPVTEFSDDLRLVVERMERLMQDARGVGLAGNQIGLLRRLFIYHPEESDGPVAVINPSIVERGTETDEKSEGCLSLQLVDVTVTRPTRVVIEAFDRVGEPMRIEAEGFDARVMQHEIDHLDGVLMYDHASPEERKQALAILRPRAGTQR